ncbi:MAG: class I SAM-dependent methyltransferase [Bacteroidales bacterium]|nr:class I SAM-dependent methyltransferase [Bacteroidales bacterium]
MSRQVEAMVGYLKHAVRAQSKYRLHSPFVYGFYQNVLKDEKTYTQYRVVNRLRNELGTVSRFIKRKDLGVRCKEYPSDQRFVRVKDIINHSSVSRKNGEFLFRLIRQYKPSSILELGTSLGISAMYFGLAAPESKIITIEGCIDSANLARENFEKTGLKNIQVLTGDFKDKLSEALVEMPSPDLVFFDGNHKLEPTLTYFEQCLPHIHPGTIFIFDDIHWSAGMEEAWNVIRKHPQVKVSIDIYHMGIVFFREELSKEDFTIRF